MVDDISILVVEPDRHMQDVCRIELGNVPSHYASSAQEALDILVKQKGIGVIVTEYDLLDHDRDVFIRTLRELNPLAHIIVVGWCDARDTRHLVDEYVAKPFERGELRHVVEHGVQQYAECRKLFSW